MIHAVRKWKDLFLHLVKTDLKLSYNNKALGYLWTVFDPIVMSGIYLFLVTYVFGRGYPGFVAHLFTSVLIWKWVGDSFNQSITALTKKSRLLLTVSFPKLILPLSAVSIPFTKLLFGFVWVIPLMLIQGVRPTFGLLWLIPILLVVFGLCFGLSAFLSILGVYFRDLSHISVLFLRSGFYLSPILYTVEDFIPERYQTLYMLNPFASVFNGVMRAIRYGEAPSVWIFWPILLALLLIYFGLKFFKARSLNIAKDL